MSISNKAPLSKIGFAQKQLLETGRQAHQKKGGEKKRKNNKIEFVLHLAEVRVFVVWTQ